MESLRDECWFGIGAAGSTAGHAGRPIDSDGYRATLYYAAIMEHVSCGTRSTISLTNPGLPAGHLFSRGVARFLGLTAPCRR